MSKNQYSWADKFPTLTELFFGKDNPTTYAPSYLSGKGKTKAVTKEATAKKVDTSKSITKEKPIKEVTKATSKTGFETRGTRKDYALQKKKSTANYRAGKI
jgi:hypothetical protein